MTRVLALVPDLLFGSRLQAMLDAAGDRVELLADPAQLHGLLGESEERTVLVVDLASGELDPMTLLAPLRDAGALRGTLTLAFYSHVDAQTRELATRAGFDLVVPRSRMAREGAELVARLAGEGVPEA
jgi:PleD family two-component response regulator